MNSPQLDWLRPIIGKACIIGDGVAVADIVRYVQGPRAPGDSDDDHSFLAGDFLIGGLNIGGGDDNVRVATATLRSLGVGALIARSFVPRFYDAAIERGLPALIIEEIAAIKPGDRLRVDIEEHKVVNKSSGDRYIVRNLYDDSLDVLRAGGLAAYRIHQARLNGGTHQ